MSAFIVPMGSLPSITSVGGTQAKTQGTTGTGQGDEFAGLLQDAFKNMESTGVTAKDTMLDLALGGSDDLHTGAIASVKSSTAINYTSSLVSAAIKAYNDLMRISI